MRVLIAPDKFAGTLTAVQAADAIAAGWGRTSPADELRAAPLADGGPGFADTVAAAVGGQLLAVTVSGPRGEPVPATVVFAGETAYVEAAQACGLHLVPEGERDPRETTTYGVGELLVAAVGAGASRIVVGLGGSATNDGGAGLLAALGAGPRDLLGRGAHGLAALRSEQVDLAAARRTLRGATLVAATDVDNPLHGLRGATVGFAEQKGATREQLPELEQALEHWGNLVDERSALAKGAGAAGGLGFALLALGAQRVPGIATVMDIVGFGELLSGTDLVVTGEGSLDWQSLRGKVVSGVAQAAMERGVPVIVLAGQVLVGRRELSALGVEAAYPVADGPAEVAASLAHPAERLADLAERIARTWSRA
jgi:glycerate kinase